MTLTLNFEEEVLNSPNRRSADGVEDASRSRSAKRGAEADLQNSVTASIVVAVTQSVLQLVTIAIVVLLFVRTTRAAKERHIAQKQPLGGSQI